MTIARSASSGPTRLLAASTRASPYTERSIRSSAVSTRCLGAPSAGPATSGRDGVECAEDEDGRDGWRFGMDVDVDVVAVAVAGAAAVAGRGSIGVRTRLSASMPWRHSWTLRLRTSALTRLRAPTSMLEASMGCARRDGGGHRGSAIETRVCASGRRVDAGLTSIATRVAGRGVGGIRGRAPAWTRRRRNTPMRGSR